MSSIPIDDTTNTNHIPHWYDDIQLHDIEIEECAKLVNGETILYNKVCMIKHKLSNDIIFKDLRSICTQLKIKGYKNQKKDKLLELIALKKMNILNNNNNGTVVKDIVRVDDTNNIGNKTNSKKTTYKATRTPEGNSNKKSKHRSTKDRINDDDDDDDENNNNDDDNNDDENDDDQFYSNKKKKNNSLNGVKMINSRFKYEMIEYDHHYNISIDVPGIKIHDMELDVVKINKIRLQAKRYINQFIIKNYDQIFSFDIKNVDLKQIVKAKLEFGILNIIINKKLPNEPRNIIVQQIESLPDNNIDNNGKKEYAVVLTLDVPGVRLDGLKVILHEYKSSINIDATRYRGGGSSGNNTTTTTTNNNNTVQKFITIDDMKYNIKHVMAYLIDGVLIITVPYKPLVDKDSFDHINNDNNNKNIDMSNKRSIPIMKPSSTNNNNNNNNNSNMNDNDDGHDDGHHDGHDDNNIIQKMKNQVEEELVGNDDNDDDTNKKKKNRLDELIEEYNNKNTKIDNNHHNHYS